MKPILVNIDSEDGWVMLGTVGQHISNLFSDFDARSYSHSKLSDLVRKTGAFDMEKIDGSHARMRVNPVGAKAR